MKQDESSRAILASFLLFMGPLVGGGGLLAMLRTQHRDLFFALLVPVGMGMWLAGFLLKWTGR